MQVSEAMDLISKSTVYGDKPALWADLGCGSGIFTLALANLLAEESVIYAIDKKKQSILQPHGLNTKIEIIQADFVNDELTVPPLDGILMANSMHFVRRKNLLLDKLMHYFKNGGQFIIIEYEIPQANPWVPYPIGFSTLKELFTGFGFSNIVKLAEKKSIYQSGKIYSCAIVR